jgi:hypothetical protein
MDNESAEAKASRLLKAFFDASASQRGQSVLLEAEGTRADGPSKAASHGAEVPPSS